MARGSIDKVAGKRGTSYKVRYDAPPDPATGERRQRSKSFSTRREAERFLSVTNHAIGTDAYVAEERITVGELCDRYLRSTNTLVRESTALARVAIVNTHILPRWRERRASSLTALAVQGMVDDLARTKAPQTVRNVYYLFSRICAQAVRWRLLAASPCVGVVLPKPRHDDRGGAWTADEARTFLERAAGDSFFPIYRLCLMTGLRRSEALALRWRDIDFANGRLSVRGSLVRAADHRFVPGAVKTHGSTRTIALDAGCVAMLAGLKKSADDRCRFADIEIDGTFVFVDENGGYLNPERVGKRFVRLVADLRDERGRALVAPITMHGMRHTHASLLAAAGVDLRTIMERLGHSTPNMTLGRYMHGSIESDKKATAALDALISPPPLRSDGDASAEAADGGG